MSRFLRWIARNENPEPGHGGFPVVGVILIVIVVLFTFLGGRSTGYADGPPPPARGSGGAL